MKKEVITLKDGKQFTEEIEKILKQAKGKELYIDDELVFDLRRRGVYANNVIFMFNNKGEIKRKVNIGDVNNRFHKVEYIISHGEEEYNIPKLSFTAVLVILA